MSTDAIDITIQGEHVRLPLVVLDRYNVYGPRYTSYPTAPEWKDDFGPDDLRRAFEKSERRDPKPSVSLYFHIPFCESLCWYCGCNVIINRNKAVSGPYLDHLKAEIDRVAAGVDRSRPAVQFHWGGGTPTYLEPEQMADLYRFAAERFDIRPDGEISLEVDPRVTTHEHVQTVAELGFNRVSMGVQDFTPQVQEAVNRVQSFEETRALVEDCRAHGFASVNIDLMYGLPYQTPESFIATVDRVIEISPDRIALFNYAHVPQLRHAQNAFRRMPVPHGFEKFEIFRRASERFTAAGYVFIGLDHFAKPTDEMAVAQADRTLWRNFQGYTTKVGTDVYAMGVSAISYVGGAFAQNFRDTPQYYERIESGDLPTMRGIWIDEDDRLRGKVIERILCHCVVVKSEIEQEFSIDFDTYFANALEALRGPEADGLVRLSEDRLDVTPLGRLFLRNLAMPFDAYLERKEPGARPVFSKTL
jgi:oxygen-independent coproporphyrinogen-3 oxidase